MNLLKRKELHNTGLKQTRVKIRNEEPHNTWYKPTRVQIRNEEPHDTGISLKPTRVQIRNEEPLNTGISLKPTRVKIRNEEHHNTGSINQQELFQKEICSMEFSHSSDSNTCKWEIPQKEVGPNGNYHMVLDGMGFQACVPSDVVCLFRRWSQPTWTLISDMQVAHLD